MANRADAMELAKSVHEQLVAWAGEHAHTRVVIDAALLVEAMKHDRERARVLDRASAARIDALLAENARLGGTATKRRRRRGAAKLRLVQGGRA